MFGYVMVNKLELKVKDFETYQAFYCGLCERLKKRHGLSSGFLLTYDMTFLAILLSSLYEEEEKKEEWHRCIMHPTEKKRVIYTEFIDYASDMDLLLCYHNLMDDWIDEHDYKKLLLARSFEKRYHEVASMYPRQRKAIKKYINHLHRCEEENNQNLDCASGFTGKLLAEIFVYRNDIWEQNLRQVGFFLGKFIYLMDAYEDVFEDKKKNNYAFTLIELLATILILALIMIIAVPNVMSTIDKNKQDTYVEDAKKMITLAEYKIRSDTSIPLPTSGNCIIVPLNSLDLSDFNEGPEGGSYDLENSYVLVARNGNSYLYYATIVENYDDSKRGIPLTSRNELNKENARKNVFSNDDLTIVKPTIGSNINGYTVTNIIDS